jgi:anti-sigma regulatory factor (Ser/Thr protein kinase)
MLCESEDELPQPLPVGFQEISLVPEGAIRRLRVCVQEACEKACLDELRALDFVTAVSEAAMNAVVHGASGSAIISYDLNGTVQVRITDAGNGIRIEDIPRATLERGYTTAGTMGHGFWIILKTADRISMVTSQEGTVIVIEQDRVSPEAPWLRD